MKKFSSKPGEISELLGIDKSTLRRLAKETMSPGVEYVAIGRTARYDKSAVEEWIKRQAIAS